MITRYPLGVILGLATSLVLAQEPSPSPSSSSVWISQPVDCSGLVRREAPPSSCLVPSNSVSPPVPSPSQSITFTHAVHRPEDTVPRVILHQSPETYVEPLDPQYPASIGDTVQYNLLFTTEYRSAKFNLTVWPENKRTRGYYKTWRDNRNMTSAQVKYEASQMVSEIAGDR